MLWILHLGYAWLPLGLGLLALSLLATDLMWSVGVHALMVGGLGSLSLGMMARVALGHTGRSIAAPRFMATGFVLVSAAALVRVAAGVVPDSSWLLAAAGILWSLAFLIYAAIYTPILIRG